MKRFISILLVIILSASILASCGKADDNTSSGNDSKTTTKESGNADSGDEAWDEDIDWDEVDDAINELDDYLKSLGWTDSDYGASVYGVWDSSVLPACVPTEPTGGVKVDRTEYKQLHHETFSENYHVGKINFADKAYERWMVMFACTETQLEEFVNGLGINGFESIYYDNDWSSDEYDFWGSGYYAYMTVNDSWDENSEYPKNVTFEITYDNYNKHPKTFQGTKLPDFGIVCEPYNELTGIGWNETDGEWEDVGEFWDAHKDSGTLPSDWSVWFNYFGVTLQQGKDYVQQLVSEGWTIAYEQEDKDWEGRDVYYAQLNKDGITAAVDTPYDGQKNMAVRFGTTAESLYY